MIGSPSPSASAREAKLWRMSWMRTSWSPAFARMVRQAVSMSVMCLPGFAPGTTQGLAGTRGRDFRTSAAEGERWTVRDPVLPSTMRISALSRSTFSQGRVMISFLRQPVSISRRIVVTAPADIWLPLPETSSSTCPRRVNSASVTLQRARRRWADPRSDHVPGRTAEARNIRQVVGTCSAVCWRTANPRQEEAMRGASTGPNSRWRVPAWTLPDNSRDSPVRQRFAGQSVLLSPEATATPFRRESCRAP